MNLQYEPEVGITHSITTTLVRTSSNQPYTSSDAGTLLDQFRSEWNSNQSSIQRDVAQLFTGKSIIGGTIGIAWVGAVCTSFGYGMVESDFNGNFASATDLSAHELGHNFGLHHAGKTVREFWGRALPKSGKSLKFVAHPGGHLSISQQCPKALQSATLTSHRSAAVLPHRSRPTAITAPVSTTDCLGAAGAAAACAGAAGWM